MLPAVSYALSHVHTKCGGVGRYQVYACLPLSLYIESFSHFVSHKDKQVHTHTTHTHTHTHTRTCTQKHFLSVYLSYSFHLKNSQSQTVSDDFPLARPFDNRNPGPPVHW